MAMEQQTRSSRSTNEADNAQLFSAVLSSLDKDQLPFLALDVLQRLQPSHPMNDLCPSVGEPIYGSYHVVFPLIFDGGPRWVVKIPINGTVEAWDELSASSLDSEANTMLLLKRETSIPLPEVFDFSSSTQNRLKCPYIVMSYILGIPLYEVWFGHRYEGASPEFTQACRHRALEGIASAMDQLGKFSSQKSGRLLFGADGKVSGTGSVRIIDQKAMLDRWLIDQNPDDNPIYAKYMPSRNWKSYYTFTLDLYPEQDPFQRGIILFLRHLISLIPEPGNIDAFVLAHPDFDIQNFLVSEEGELQGIIDWDGIAAVPRSLGNESYPGWLTRDWDPVMYGYKESMERGVEPEGVWEDSPECLTTCRGFYRDTMAKCIAKSERASNVDFCRMSLITESLVIAARDPRCRHAILRKMVHEIWSAAGRDDEPMLVDVADIFAKGSLDTGVMQIISTGFSALLSRADL